MTTQSPNDNDDPHKRRIQMLISRLADLTLLLPAVTDQIAGDEIRPSELLTLANRLHGIAEHMAVVADNRRINRRFNLDGDPLTVTPETNSAPESGPNAGSGASRGVRPELGAPAPGFGPYGPPDDPIGRTNDPGDDDPAPWQR